MGISIYISDLFFMIDNSAYFDEELREEAREQALRKNAESFALLVNKIEGNELGSEGAITADMVIEDFKARI